MFKITLLLLSSLLFINCGGSSSSTPIDKNTTVDVDKNTTVAENIDKEPKVLTSTQKIQKVSKELNLEIITFPTEVNIISGKEKYILVDKLFILLDENNQRLAISSSDELEKLEKKEGIVITAQKVSLPDMEKGYGNIITESNETQIKQEIKKLFDDGGVNILSYSLDDMEKTPTLNIYGDSNLFTCTNSKNNEIYEITSKDSKLALPIANEGDYLCLDQYENQAFEYNLTIEDIKDVEGSLYTFNPKRENGASVKVYNIVSDNVDLASTEERLKENLILGSDDDLVLRVFYRVFGTENPPIEVFEDKTYVLKKGAYELSYSVSSPQNNKIDNSFTHSNPINIIEKARKTTLTAK